MNKKWDLRFLQLAEHVSQWSKDPSTKCGAVLVSPDKKRVVFGYNGFPENMKDTEKRLNDRGEKLDRVVHAEINALLNSQERLWGWTLYTYPFLTCHRCAVQVIQAGVKRVVSYDIGKKHRWHESLSKAKEYYDECGVKWMEYERFPSKCEHHIPLSSFCKTCADEQSWEYITDDGELNPPRIRDERGHS